MPKLGLFIPPRLRSGQEAEVERHASWLELFYDLVFVAAVIDGQGGSPQSEPKGNGNQHR